MHQNNQTGQIGLVVLLIGAVLMTIGLGTASQSIFESRSARQETESTQTFNAVEQGIEQALRDLEENDGEVTDISGLPSGIQGTFKSEKRTDLRTQVRAGQSANVVLDNNINDFNITWETPNGDCSSAIIVTIIGDTLKRYAYKHQLCPTSNGFAAASCAGSSCTADILFPLGVSNPRLARIKVVYGATTLQVGLGSSTGVLPTQAHNILSTANRSGEQMITVNVYAPVAALPSIFDYTLFSGSGNIQ